MATTPPISIDAANAQALERVFASRPFLIGVQPAREVLPGMEKHTVLHAGPPWLGMSCVARCAAPFSACYNMKVGPQTRLLPRR